MFEMLKLEYAEDALEPHISAEVIKYHYHKHTQKYFDTANELAKGTVFEGKDLRDVINKDTMIRMETKLFNNVSQAWNHAFYWKCLTPASSSGKPSEALEKAMVEHFGSVEEFSKEFADKATKYFGSGWCWLVWKDGRLVIKTTPNATSPLTEKDAKPLLGCDVWEHAHYLQYPADRAAYVKAFMNVINWDFVNKNFEEAQ
jgi:superoxide dismutase, Fe-Mn family